MKMSKKQKEEMNQFMEEFEVEKGMEKTYSGDVDITDDIPLIEEDYNGIEEQVFSDLEEEEEEYSEDEISMFLENVNFEESKTNLSFDEMMPSVVPESGIKYQRKEKVVTPHFLVLRENVKRTPSVCPYRDCMYDGAQAISFKNWDKTPASKRRIALAALERHTQIKHKFQDSDIIDEAQIPTSWLSPTII